MRALMLGVATAGLGNWGGALSSRATAQPSAQSRGLYCVTNGFVLAKGGRSPATIERDVRQIEAEVHSLSQMRLQNALHICAIERSLVTYGS